MVIEVKNPEKPECSDMRIDHFFADSPSHAEDRIVAIMKGIKETGLETIQYEIFPVDVVDGLDISKFFKMIVFDRKG